MFLLCQQAWPYATMYKPLGRGCSVVDLLPTRLSVCANYQSCQLVIGTRAFIRVRMNADRSSCDGMRYTFPTEVIQMSHVSKPTPTQQRPEPLLVPAEVAFDMLGIGRTAGFSLIKSGQLAARKIGMRTMVEVRSVKDFIRALPVTGAADPLAAFWRHRALVADAFSRWVATGPAKADVDMELAGTISQLRQLARFGLGAVTEAPRRRPPWLKFYPSDWRADAALRACSYAARGMWMDLLALMHEAEPYGHLLISGQPPDNVKLTRVLGGSPEEIAALVAELREAGVFSTTEHGVIFSRRMVRDAAQALVDRQNGRRGGNPELKASNNPGHIAGTNHEDNGGVNPPVIDGDKRADKAQKLESRSQNKVDQRSSDGLDFDAFWAAYPRKVGKGSARTAYARALKAGATAGAILDGVRGAHWNPDPQFVPHPATWLNGDRWLDERLPPAELKPPATGPTAFVHCGNILTLDDLAGAA